MNTKNTCIVPAGKVPEPGRMSRVEAFGERVLIANVEGTFYAVSDTCSHEDASLSLGALKGDRVTCPLHGSRFCLKTGKALDEPAELPLKTYATHFDEGRLMLAIK